MTTPFEDSLAAALRSRLGDSSRRFESATLSLERLTLDVPASQGEVDHAELAEAIASAVDDLLTEAR